MMVLVRSRKDGILLEDSYMTSKALTAQFLKSRRGLRILGIIRVHNPQIWDKARS